MNSSKTLRAISSRGTRMRLVLVLLGVVFAWQGAAPARADDGPRLN